jgi:hypothetical protein
MRKTNLARLPARRPEGIFVSDFEQGEIGPDVAATFVHHTDFDFNLEIVVTQPTSLIQVASIAAVPEPSTWAMTLLQPPK